MASVCAACGNHFPDPRPGVCAVCADERQWLPPGGQRWTTLAELASAVLHWAAGADGRGVLLSGDTLFVTPGEHLVTFVWSAPNRLPLSEAAVTGVWHAVRPYRFDRIYGGWWSPVLRSDACETVRRSAARYIEHLRGTA